MKKFLTLLFIIVFWLNSVLADYTPTNKDKKTLINLSKNFELLYKKNPSKVEDIYNKIKEVKPKIKNQNSSTYYLISELEKSLSKTLNISTWSIDETIVINNNTLSWTIDNTQSDKNLIKEKLKEKAKEDWPNDYTTQEYWINSQLQAYDYMLKIENNPIKQKAQEDWTLDFTTQKYWYNQQIDAKNRLNK